MGLGWNITSDWDHRKGMVNHEVDGDEILSCLLPFLCPFFWRWVALGLGETEALQLLHHLNSWNSGRSHSVISHNAAISSCEKSAEWRWALCLLCHGGSWIGLKETSTVAPMFFLKRWLLNHQDIDYIGDSSINDGWSPIMIRWFIN